MGTINVKSIPPDAEDIPILDADGYYVGTEVEAALDEVGLLKAPLASPTFTGAVIVPSATAATHAARKESVDLKVSRAGDTMAGALTLASDPTGSLDAATKQYVDTYGLGGDPASSASSVSIADADSYYVGTEVEAALQEVGLLKAPLASPTFTGSVIVPAADAATEAAQVSAIDATTGRLAIGGVELGDTGWRDVTDDCTATLTAGAVHIKRQGSRVYIKLTSDARLADTSTYYVLPSGFVPDNDYHFGSFGATRPANLDKITFQRLRNASLSTVQVPAPYDATAYYVNHTVDVPCSRAWPSSLPGTAA